MGKINTIVLVLVLQLLATTMALGQMGTNPPTSGNAEQTAEGSRDPSHFTYLRLYCTPDGNSHFQSVVGELRKTNFAPPAAPLYIGDKVPASSAFFGGFDAGWGSHDLQARLYHPAPAVQFAIVVGGVFSITATDGETKRLQPGDVIRLEDTAPCKGHITVVGDQPGFWLFVP
jgi:hypothetical protein